MENVVLMVMACAPLDIKAYTMVVVAVGGCVTWASKATVNEVLVEKGGQGKHDVSDTGHGRLGMCGEHGHSA